MGGSHSGFLFRPLFPSFRALAFRFVSALAMLHPPVYLAVAGRFASDLSTLLVAFDTLDFQICFRNEHI